MRKQKWKLIALCYLGVLACWTWQRNEVWSHELSFLADQLEKAPNKRRIYCNYASALNAHRLYTQTIELMNEAKRRGPLLPGCLYSLGKAQLESGLFVEAQANLAHSYELDATCLLCLREAGLAAYYATQFVQALKHFNDLAQRRPPDAILLAYIGSSYQRLGQLERAQSSLEASLELEDDNEVALEGLIWLFVEQKQRGKALELWQRMKEVVGVDAQRLQRVRAWLGLKERV